MLTLFSVLHSETKQEL